MIWKQETKRMGVESAFPIVANARKPLPVNISADLVILDPPCTSTGTFSKMPSAKWRLNKRSISGMARIQWQMLDQCAEYVKERGFLVYSTCSVTVEENEMLIERFLKWHTEFKLVETLPKIGLPGLRGQTECQRLYPHLHDCNGFFVAKLLRETIWVGARAQTSFYVRVQLEIYQKILISFGYLRDPNQNTCLESWIRTIRTYIGMGYQSAACMHL